MQTIGSTFKLDYSC